MTRKPVFCPLVKTQLSFCNVPVAPVRTRSGERRFLSATWGGAIHLFDERGREKVIPYPVGGQGSYSFVADVEDGFAWAVHTGGVITRIDVDAAAYDFVEKVPLEIINWGAAITREGLLVCAASPGDVMVYDTRARRVRHMIRPISATNHYGHYPRALADGRIVIPMSTPGKEFVLLDPRAGEFHAIEPESLRDLAWFPRSLTVLADGRLAVPRETRVLRFDYPGFAEAPALEYPSGFAGPWETFRDYGNGRLFAYPKPGGPLFALDERCEWGVYLPRFSPEVGRIASIMFAALEGGRLLGLSLFGELVVWGPNGAARQVAQLDNLGHQRISDLAPDNGSTVFTTTFINASCQVMDWRTGEGRNIRPCQDHGGQASCAVAVDGKLWLACYGGAEINCFDPAERGEWPANPRPVAKIGHGQMRPTALAWDGRFLWCATHAQYGTLGGALSRTETRTGECRVWRNLAGDHNLSSLALDGRDAPDVRGLSRCWDCPLMQSGMPGQSQHRDSPYDVGERPVLPSDRHDVTTTVFAGTDIHADCDSAPAAEGPAAVVAFDARSETVAWTARPVETADVLHVIGLCDGALLVSFGGAQGELLQLDPRNGHLVARFSKKFPAHWTSHELLIGPDGALYVACVPDGLFRYDLTTGPQERIIEGPVEKPRVRGRDLFFIRGHDLGIVEGAWR